jgi:hypothetical protein
MKSIHLFLCCIGLMTVSEAGAALVYLESSSGELSGAGGMPTALSFSLGNNTVSGMMGRSTSVDADIFQFTVASGESITSMFLSQYTPAGSAASGSFFAIASGSSINTGDGSAHAANNLVSASSGEFLSSSVLLGSKFSGGASTLTNPIGPGTYTVWFQETATTVNYTLNFVLVPEPSSALLAFCSLGLLARRRR